jgi:hypothetical protein
VNPVQDTLQIPTALWRAYGGRGLLRRAVYELVLRSGGMRRLSPIRPTYPKTSKSPHDWPVHLDLHAVRTHYAASREHDALKARIVDDADRVLAGHMRFYGWAWRHTGWPPDWHRNPWTGHRYPRVHWSLLSDNQPANGDIKDVWEMSRLPFTSTFARAYALTGDGRYVDAWWEGVEDWARANPPNVGVNYRCGQETSLRGLSLQFGLAAFAEHPASTPARLALAYDMLAAFVARVRPTMHYALSQRNNHAISEAVFLETAALLDIAPKSNARRARRALQEALADQFYDCGWYAQHSFSYQRLALQCLVWLKTVRAAVGLRPDIPIVDQALARSAALWEVAADPWTGQLPMCGAIDGSLLFDLGAGSELDSRPMLHTLRGAKGRPPGAQEEERAWLGLEPVTAVEPTACREHMVFLRTPNLHASMRTGLGRHRPSHIDYLHLQVRMGGHLVTVDPGTFRYTDPSPLGGALRESIVHNGPCLSEHPDRTLGRFLTASSPKHLRVSRRQDGCDEEVVAQLTLNGTVLSRSVSRRSDDLEVIDEASGRPFMVTWTLPPEASIDHLERGAVLIGLATATLRFEATWVDIYNGPSGDSRGWFAPHYAEKRPCLAISGRSDDSPMITTIRRNRRAPAPS